MKVATFGEIMLRFSPVGMKRFTQSNEFGVAFGGAEANVAVALSNWGQQACYITKLPDHEIGQMAINTLRTYGVDTGKIVRGGYRIGTYYCEKGASQRPSKVIYDRANSAFALSKYEEYDWDAIFAENRWFHITGITPALGNDMQNIALSAMKEAKVRGVTVSMDINYRSKLWCKEDAKKTITQLLPYVDVLIANENQVLELTGVSAPDIKIENDEYSPELNRYLAREMEKMYGIKTCAFTARRTKSSEVNSFRGMICSGGQFAFSNDYLINIVDRVGSGDSFAAGIIYSLVHNFDLKDSIDFAVCSAVLNHSIEGDFNIVTTDEIFQLMKNGSAKVQR